MVAVTNPVNSTKVATRPPRIKIHCPTGTQQITAADLDDPARLADLHEALAGGIELPGEIAKLCYFAAATREKLWKLLGEATATLSPGLFEQSLAFPSPTTRPKAYAAARNVAIELAARLQLPRREAAERIVDARIAAGEKLARAKAVDGIVRALYAADATAPQFSKMLSTKEFLAGAKERDWLIPGVLVRLALMFIGGEVKTLKTMIALELAIALAFGGRLFGELRWRAKQCRVGIWSGETDQAALGDAFRRICKARKCDPDNANIEWNTFLPKLSLADDLRRMQQVIRDLRLDVVIIDPSSRCLLTRDAANQANSQMFMGAVFEEIINAIRETNATPILCAHFKQGTGADGDTLNALAHAGLAASAAQWIGLFRQEKYAHDGCHKLRVEISGRGVAGEELMLQVDEGQPISKWQTRLTPVNVAKASEIEAKKDRKRAEKLDEANEQLGRLLEALAKCPPEGETEKRLRGLAQLGETTITRAAEIAIGRGLIKEFQMKKKGCKSARAYRLIGDAAGPGEGLENDGE